MMRDDVAVIARHRMMRGLNRIDGLAARRETGQEAAGDERVERRRERRVVAAFEFAAEADIALARPRSEEHTSELQSLMRISYAVFCLKKKNRRDTTNIERSD